MARLIDPPAEILLDLTEYRGHDAYESYGITSETETSRPPQQEDWEKLNETIDSLLPHKAHANFLRDCKEHRARNNP
jgi:hypothetical protein